MLYKTINMKKNLTPLFIFAHLYTFGQIGIGTSTPNSSSILEIKSKEKGFLPPRLSSSERNAILDPAEGLIIYNKTLDCLEFFNAVKWTNICGLPDPILPEIPLSGIDLNCQTLQINPNTGSTGVNYVGVLEVPINFTGSSQNYAGQTEFTSTLVTGLTARLRSGAVTNGSTSNVLIFDVTGIPSGSGSASFIIDFNQLPIGGCGVVLNIN